MAEHLRSEEETLYDDGRIKVVYNTKRDLHFLTMGSNSVVLDRGILDDLAHTSRGHDFRNKFEAVDPTIEHILESQHLTYDTVGFVIAQARLRELEAELSQVYHQERKRRGKIC